MSNSDFQDRLERIGERRASEVRIDSATGPTATPPKRKSGMGPIIIGAVLILVGAQAIGVVNENYEVIRAGSGVGTAVGLGLAALVLPLLGVVFLVHGLISRR